MNILSNAITDFIHDFKLVKKDDIICFDAIIYITTTNFSTGLSSEVQIVTNGSENMTVSYLLNPEITKHGIPDEFHGSADFKYFQNLALIIKGKSSIHGKYTLSIHPGNKKCDERTLAEIHAKMYN